jgi:hypothetical protein
VQQREGADQRERARARAREVHEARPPNALALVLGGDAEEGRERHHLPSDEEGERVPRDQDQAGAAGDEPERESQTARAARVLARRPVGEGVEARDARDAERRQEEERGERVDADRDAIAEHEPGKRERLLRRSRVDEERCRAGAEQREAQQGGCAPIRRRGIARQRQPRQPAQRGERDGEHRERGAHDGILARHEIQASAASTAPRMYAR